MEARAKMLEAFDNLEEAHTAYVVAIGIDLDEDPNSADAAYLDTPMQERMDALFKYSESRARIKEIKDCSELVEKKAELKDKFD